MGFDLLFFCIFVAEIMYFVTRIIKFLCKSNKYFVLYKTLIYNNLVIN